MMSIALRRRFYGSLAAALLLSSSLTAVSVVGSSAARADEASEQSAVDAFFDYGYGSCDAEVLSKYWNADYWDTKVWAGLKVQDGDHGFLADELTAAYAAHLCDHSASLGYDDSMDVAALWSATAPA